MSDIIRYVLRLKQFQWQEMELVKMVQKLGLWHHIQIIYIKGEYLWFFESHVCDKGIPQS